MPALAEVVVTDQRLPLAVAGVIGAVRKELPLNFCLYCFS